MRKRVHRYLACGVAAPDHPDRYPASESQQMLIFLSGYTDQYDWSTAEQAATRRENYARLLTEGSALVGFGAIDSA